MSKIETSLNNIAHISQHRRTEEPTTAELLDAVEKRMSAHFREQNELLRSSNAGLSNQVQRLTGGIEALVKEMHGIRTGRKDEAFAKVAPSNVEADLPSFQAESAVIYTLTSKTIGEKLGFHCSQIGQLLGPKGLNWADDSDYQEVTRFKKGAPRYWHFEIIEKIEQVLTNGDPDDLGIKSKVVRSIFNTWKSQKRHLLSDLEFNLPS